MKRVRDREEGFTLIELMVVVLIIAILIAIAIPTFLGARTRAQDRAAQSSLRNALTAAKTIFTDHENYNEATATSLEEVEPSLEFVTTDSEDQNTIDVLNVSEDVWVGAAQSRSGKCFYIRDSSGAGGPGTEYAVDEDADPCAATDTPTGDWQQEF
jgi:type IV pilus assembly protein PilA